MGIRNARLTLLLIWLLGLVVCGIAFTVGAVPGKSLASLSLSPFEATASLPNVPSSDASLGYPALPRSAAQAPLTYTYSIVELTATNGTPYYALGLNEATQVVGGLEYSANEYHPFLWHADVLTDLGTLGGPDGSAADVNEAGQIVGSAQDAGYNFRAFLWQDGAMHSLGTLGGNGSYAAAINDPGHVVGVSFSNLYTDTRAFLWQDGAMRDLGSLECSVAEAWDINNADQVVGDEECRGPYGTTRALLWQGGGIIYLGNLGGSFSRAFGINDAGQVVGRSALPNGDLRAFLWQNGSMVDLGALDGGPSTAEDINDAGLIVGTSGSSGLEAVLWQDGSLYNLNDQIPAGSGWHLEHAYAVNNAGQIVGMGTLDGTMRAFLLNPVPWTLLFYLDGDNSLGPTYTPIFNQLEAAANNPAVRIVVLWDNLSTGDSAYYEVQYDTDMGHFASYTQGENYWPKGELDMSQPSTLSDFVVWAMERYRSPHYALILDNHGTGLGGGLVEGDPYVRLMDLRQMQSALSTAFQQTGRTVDVLYMAMCLMAMLEDGYQFRGLADYYVASENVQWAYDEPYFGYVAGIGRESTAADVAQNLANSYASSGAAYGGAYTISVGSLGLVEPLAAATYQLGSALDSHLTAISPTLAIVLAGVQRYDNELPSEVIDLNDTYVDLYDLAARLEESVPEFPDIITACQGVTAALANYVMFESHGSGGTYDLSGSHGVSLFFPATASNFYNAGNYDFAAGANWGGPAATRTAPQDITWGAFLVDYFQLTQPGGPNDETPPEPLPKLVPVTHQTYLPLILQR